MSFNALMTYGFLGLDNEIVMNGLILSYVTTYTLFLTNLTENISEFDEKSLRMPRGLRKKSKINTEFYFFPLL